MPSHTPFVPNSNNLTTLPDLFENHPSNEDDENHPLFIESSDPYDLYIYSLNEIIVQHLSKYQDILIADTENYGRALMLDGSIQSAEYDEALYHEMLVHPPMLAHPNPRNILILGGGEGATLREVLKHPSVESVVMVDIDEELVNLCRKHLPQWHQGSFEDPRLTLIYEDAATFLKHNKDLYDVIIVDLIDAHYDYDSAGYEVAPFYTVQFYENVAARLNPGGLVGIQAMELDFDLDQEAGHYTLSRTVGKVFTHAPTYTTFIPSFLGIWSFIIASQEFNVKNWSLNAITASFQKRLNPNVLSHLTPELIHASLQLSKQIEALHAVPGPVWTHTELLQEARI